MKLSFVLFLIFFLATCFLNSAIAADKQLPDPKTVKYSTGTIDRISGEEIVIDDSLYKYASGVQFVSSQNSSLSSDRFNKGEKIKFSINSHHKVQIIKKK